MLNKMKNIFLTALKADKMVRSYKAPNCESTDAPCALWVFAQQANLSFSLDMTEGIWGKKVKNQWEKSLNVIPMGIWRGSECLGKANH